MSAAGMGAASTSSTIYYRERRGSSSQRRRSSVSAAQLMAAKRPSKDVPKFYIPGEAASGHFPGETAETDAAKDMDRKKESSRMTSWLTSHKIWSFLQNYIKKEAKMTEADIFNEACALKLAAQFSINRNRNRRQLDQLVKVTDFTESELKLLYWGWKQGCPSGSLTEANFKEIYAQFFPQAGDSSFYAKHVYRAMFGAKSTGEVTFSEYVVALSALSRGTTRDKLAWIFRLYDIDGDDRITLSEMEEICKSVYSLLGYYVTPPYDRRTSDRHAGHIFDKLDKDKKGFVTKEDFVDICEKDESIVNSLQLLDTQTLC